VTKDEKEAVRWYTKAAELGQREAMTGLGRCYEYGTGVDKDIDKAVEWYRKAAKLGQEMAKENLRRLGKD